jgi:hypothetical protein
VFGHLVAHSSNIGIYTEDLLKNDDDCRLPGAGPGDIGRELAVGGS